MIITRLTGGLGNQMFQYAAGLALAQARRSVLKLDVSWFREYEEYEGHNRYELSCLNITEQFATAEEVDRSRGVVLTRAERWAKWAAQRLHFYRYAARDAAPGRWHRSPGFAYYPDFLAQPDGTYLDGMFQSERFFAPAAGVLRRHFTPRYPASAAASALAAQIRQGPAAAVHVRRGDYARNPAFRQELGVVPAGYYTRAAALVRRRHPEVTFYVFSDDIEAAAREITLPGPHVFVRGEGALAADEELFLMSQCDHAILGNSTFGWWAAWLNPAPGRTVIAPEPWFAASRHDTREVVPAAWERLAREP